MGKKLKIVFWLVVAITAFLLLGGVVYNFVRATSEETIHPEVTFEIENLGTIKMELYQEYAPNTVANIVKLVEKGYYTNKVIYGKNTLCLYFGTTEDGTEDIPQASLVNSEIGLNSEQDFAYTIPGEFLQNGFNKNTLCHEKGVVTLIRDNYGSSLLEQGYNSGVSKMGIIMEETAANLNGTYAAFGKITEGLELLENLYLNAETKEPEVDETTGEVVSSIEQFSDKLVIKSATVNTYGIDFGVPEMVEYFNYDEYVYQMLSSQYAS